MQNPYKSINPKICQISSNNLKKTQMTSEEPVIGPVQSKTKSKLKGGNPNDNSTQGRDLIEQAFSSQQMAEYIEILKKDPNIQNKFSQTIDEYNKKSISTRSEIGQKALIQS